MLNVIRGCFEILVHLFLYSFCIYVVFIRHDNELRRKRVINRSDQNSDSLSFRLGVAFMYEGLFWPSQ